MSFFGQTHRRCLPGPRRLDIAFFQSSIFFFVILSHAEAETTPIETACGFFVRSTDAAFLGCADRTMFALTRPLFPTVHFPDGMTPPETKKKQDHKKKLCQILHAQSRVKKIEIKSLFYLEYTAHRRISLRKMKVLPEK